MLACEKNQSWQTCDRKYMSNIEKRMAVNQPGSDSDFKEIKHLSRADERGRLTLGAVAKKKNYRVMINQSGQILLDPVVTVPEQEAWLWKNQAALDSVQRGLQQAAAGETEDLGSFGEHADLNLNE